MQYMFGLAIIIYCAYLSLTAKQLACPLLSICQEASRLVRCLTNQGVENFIPTELYCTLYSVH